MLYLYSIIILSFASIYYYVNHGTTYYVYIRGTYSTLKVAVLCNTPGFVALFCFYAFMLYVLLHCFSTLVHGNDISFSRILCMWMNDNKVT